MKTNTLESYKAVIKSLYQKAVSEDITELMTTPAGMRNLCVSLCNHGLTVNDERILRSFFEIKDTEDLLRGITNGNIALFKPIRSFLKGENNTDNLIRIELSALLVGYHSRPFAKYAKQPELIEIAVLDGVESSSLVEEHRMVNNSVEVKRKALTVLKNNYQFSFNLGWIIGVGLLLVVLGSFVLVKVFANKQCMQWSGNHYEVVDCQTEQLGLVQANQIIPVDESALKLQKLDSKQKIVFFKNEIPLVWYSKNKGVIELYDRQGFHPLTGKPLKPITNYMIEKYALEVK